MSFYCKYIVNTLEGIQLEEVNNIIYLVSERASRVRDVSLRIDIA